jgi:PAS domain S-box-containing protein
LLETAPDALIVVDGAGMIVFANAQAERLFGYARQDLLGQSVEVLVPQAARTGHPAMRATYEQDPYPRPMGSGIELAARRRDGTEFPAEISLSALETAEGLLVSAAVRDITGRLEVQAERERRRMQADHERLERSLEQSQRLESLGELAGGVAHDFNNLLGAILNYASFVEDEVARAAQTDAVRWEPVGRDVVQIRRAAERAARLTHQLLAFARREVIRPERVDLNEIVKDVEDLLRRTLGEHVELFVNLAAEPLATLAEPGKIEQVLVNVAVNARDAMPDGGHLEISTAVRTLDEERASEFGGEPGRYVELRLTDTGAGMDPDVLRRAFEPFFSTKRSEGGSGLGLATVYGIVKQAGGHATLASTPRSGTTFVALFPETELSPGPAERRGNGARPAGGETILIAEDEDAMLEVSRRLLARNGYQVLTAPGGPEAVELAATYDGNIDLLLTDVVMPQMFGKEVAARVLETRPETRVLFMSGYASPVMSPERELGPNVALIDKPFSESVLLQRVREVLDASDDQS